MGLPFEPEPRDRRLFAYVDRDGTIGLLGALRARALELEAGLVDELREIDSEVQRLVDRRATVADGLRQCRDALDGNSFRSWIRRRPWPGELDAQPERTTVVRGEALRSALRYVLEAAARPLTVAELHRGLLARGLRPPGRASHAISNALTVEIGAGRAARDHRGVYRIA